MSELEELEWICIEDDGVKAVYHARQAFALIELTFDSDGYNAETYAEVVVFIDGDAIGRGDAFAEFDDDEAIFEWAAERAAEILDENGY